VPGNFSIIRRRLLCVSPRSSLLCSLHRRRCRCDRFILHRVRRNPTTWTNPSARTSPAPALDDPTIVAIFDAANTADIGDRRARRKRVRRKKSATSAPCSFATTRWFVNRAATSPRSWRDPDAPEGRCRRTSPRRGDEATACRSGSAFDHAFLQHEVAFHKGVIDAVTTTLLPALKNAEVKDLVTKVAPAFQAHMLAAENLDKQLAAK
jgi:putative membrane protein